MITCMNTYLLSPNHCYNWAPCLGVRLSCLTRSDVSQVTVACKHLASFTFDIQLLWNCGLAKPRGVNRETGSDPCLVSQLVSTCLSPVRTEISAHLKEGRLPSICFLCEEKWQIQVINRKLHSDRVCWSPAPPCVSPRLVLAWSTCPGSRSRRWRRTWTSCTTAWRCTTRATAGRSWTRPTASWARPNLSWGTSTGTDATLIFIPTLPLHPHRHWRAHREDFH